MGKSKFPVLWLTIFSGIIFWMVPVIQVCALEKPWNELNSQTLELYQQGKYMKAVKIAAKALDVAKDSFSPDDPRLADAFYVSAQMNQTIGQCLKAEALYSDSLLIRWKSNETENYKTALCYYHLAELRLDLGNVELAEENCRMALSMVQKIFGAYHPQVGNGLGLLARIYLEQQKVGDAEKTIQEALAIIEQVHGKEQADTAGILIIQSQIFLSVKKDSEAFESNRRAMAILKKMNRGKNGSFGKALLQQGIIEKSTGKYNEAIKSLKQAQALYENFYSPNHPEVAVILTEMAGLFKQQRKYSQALSLYQQANTIRGAALGAENFKIADGIFQQAETCDFLGLYRKAEWLYLQSLKLRRDIKGPEHPEVVECLTRLAEQYIFQAKFDEAEWLCRDILSLTKKRPDLEVMYGTALNLSARIAIEKSDKVQAAAGIQKALEIMGKNYPKDHVAIAKCQENQVRLAILLGNYKEADSLIPTAEIIFTKFFGLYHPYLIIVFEDKYRLYMETGQYENAQKLVKQIQKIRVKITRDNDNTPMSFSF